MNERCFERFHPIVLFVYFVGVIFISMITMNPVIIGITFLSSVIFCGMLIGVKKLTQSLCYSLIMIVLIALTNPLFVHKGETALFYLNGNPVTLEAIMYGVAASFMLMSVFYWFKCYNEVMTSDKFIYLFGRVIPKLSLLLSMVLRFVPKFKKQYSKIDKAQKALGIYTSKSFVDKIRSKFRVISILITWALENSIETADSMRARGYGLKGRSSYSIFKWRARDTVMLLVISALTVFCSVCVFTNICDFSFYPTFSVLSFGTIAICFYVGLFVLMFITSMLEIKENIKWRLLTSKI